MSESELPLSRRSFVAAVATGGAALALQEGQDSAGIQDKRVQEILSSQLGNLSKEEIKTALSDVLTEALIPQSELKVEKQADNLFQVRAREKTSLVQVFEPVNEPKQVIFYFHSIGGLGFDQSIWREDFRTLQQDSLIIAPLALTLNGDKRVPGTNHASDCRGAYAYNAIRGVLPLFDASAHLPQSLIGISLGATVGVNTLSLIDAVPPGLLHITRAGFYAPTFRVGMQEDINNIRPFSQNDPDTQAIITKWALQDVAEDYGISPRDFWKQILRTPQLSPSFWTDVRQVLATESPAFMLMLQDREKKSTNVKIISADGDTMIPSTQTAAVAKGLSENGYAVQQVRVPGSHAANSEILGLPSALLRQ